MESLMVLLWKWGRPLGPEGGPPIPGKAFPVVRGLRPITEVISFMAENSLGCGAGLGGRGTPPVLLTLRMLWLVPLGGTLKDP